MNIGYNSIESQEDIDLVVLLSLSFSFPIFISLTWTSAFDPFACCCALTFLTFLTCLAALTALTPLTALTVLLCAATTVVFSQPFGSIVDGLTRVAIEDNGVHIEDVGTG